MGCWTRVGLIAIGLVGTGPFGFAQTPIPVTTDGVLAPVPTPAATDGTREGEVLVFHSAGQPERRLQVLRVSTIPNGPTLVDVKDLESGSQYTLPAQALAAAKRVGTVLPTPPALPTANTVTRTPVEPPAFSTPAPNIVPRTPIMPPPVAKASSYAATMTTPSTPAPNIVPRTPFMPLPPVAKASSYAATMTTPPVSEYRTTYAESVSPAAMAQSRTLTPAAKPASTVASSTLSNTLPPLALPQQQWKDTAGARTPSTIPLKPVPSTPVPGSTVVAAPAVAAPAPLPTPTTMTSESEPESRSQPNMIASATKMPESKPAASATATAPGLPQATLPAAFQRHPIASQSTTPNTGWPQMASSTVRPWPQFGQPVVTPTVAAGLPTSPKQEAPTVANDPPVRSHPIPAWQQATATRTPVPTPSAREPQNETPLMRPSVLAKLAAMKQPEPKGIETPSMAIAVPEQPLLPVAQQTPTPSNPIPVIVPTSVPAAATPPVPMIATIATPPVQTVTNPPTPAAHWQAASTDTGIQTVSLSQPTRAERWVAAAPTTRMAAEIQPWVNDLANALRPSVRETAATALAEGRYGSRPEVKSALANAAMTDPAVSVRAHCIRILSTLGYHENDYVSYLRAVGYSGEPEVQSAAVAALARLSPR